MRGVEEKPQAKPTPRPCPKQLEEGRGIQQEGKLRGHLAGEDQEFNYGYTLPSLRCQLSSQVQMLGKQLVAQPGPEGGVQRRLQKGGRRRGRVKRGFWNQLKTLLCPVVLISGSSPEPSTGGWTPSAPRSVCPTSRKLCSVSLLTNPLDNLRQAPSVTHFTDK